MKRTLALPFALLLLSSLASFSLAGCTYRARAGSQESTDGQNAETADTAVAGSHWYYFSDTGIHAAINPQDIPARKFKPWTEAVRVADSCEIDGTPSFLINRLGIMTTASGSGAAALHQEQSLFPASTAGALYRSNGETLVRLYRSSFFSDAAKSGADNACIARYENSSGTFSPLLAPVDFGLTASAQCVALDRIGSMWYASFKDESAGKVDFTYLEFPAIPANKSDGFSGIQRISKEDYQKSVTPFAFSDAPEALVTLLAGIPEATPFSLRVHSASGEAAQTYVRTGMGTEVEGSALVSGKERAALFADGSFYFSPSATGGKVSRLQLPALSRGYVYTDFVIAGKKILAAWEEQRFFETGRAGLLEISIPDEVY